jgi:hypothetical protein
LPPSSIKRLHRPSPAQGFEHTQIVVVRFVAHVSVVFVATHGMVPLSSASMHVPPRFEQRAPQLLPEVVAANRHSVAVSLHSM